MLWVSQEGLRPRPRMEKPPDTAPLKGGDPKVPFVGSTTALPDQPSQLAGLRLTIPIWGEIGAPCTSTFEISSLIPAQETGARAASVSIRRPLPPPPAPRSLYSQVLAHAASLSEADRSIPHPS